MVTEAAQTTQAAEAAKQAGAEGTEQAVSPASSLEELQTKVVGLEAERTQLAEKLHQENEESKKHRSGQDRVISQLKRELKDTTTELKDAHQDLDDLLAFVKPDETAEAETLQRYEAARLRREARKTARASSSAPFSPAQKAAAQELFTILKEANIDPEAPPEDMVKVLDRVNSLFDGGLTDRAISVLERAVGSRGPKAAPNKEPNTPILKTPTAEETRRAEAAKGLQTSTASPAVGGPNVTLQALRAKGVHRMDMDELQQYKRLILDEQRVLAAGGK